jgi:hypothetical protein
MERICWEGQNFSEVVAPKKKKKKKKKRKRKKKKKIFTY